MALSKLTTLANGTSGAYWKVTSIGVDNQQLTLTCQLSLFTSQAVADSGQLGLQLGPPIGFIFNVTKAQLAGDPVALAYNLIVPYANAVVTHPDGTTSLQCPAIAGATNC